MTTEHESRSEALARLAGERDAGSVPPTRLPKKLALAELHLETKIFQQRGFAHGEMASQSHIRNLQEAAKVRGKDGLDAMDVWWSGARWIIVDGHHRLAAYLRHAKTEGLAFERYKVPVKPINPHSLERAIVVSGEGNAKDKLAMSKADKTNSAWFMVCTTGLSKRELAAAQGVSGSIIAHMRRVKTMLTAEQAKSQGVPPVADLSCQSALNIDP